MEDPPDASLAFMVMPSPRAPETPIFGCRGLLEAQPAGTRAALEIDSRRGGLAGPDLHLVPGPRTDRPRKARRPGQMPVPSVSLAVWRRRSTDTVVADPPLSGFFRDEAMEVRLRRMDAVKRCHTHL